MTALSTVPLNARLVGLRLHARRGPGGVPASPRARALLDLEARNKHREADDQALRELVAAVRAHVDELPGIVRTRLDEVAAIAVELGLAIAHEIVGAALERGAVDPTAVVARCLADCVHGSSRSDLVVRLHPDDLPQVQAKLPQLAGRDEEIATTTFVGDAGVPRGGVRAETGAGRLCYDPRDILERICEEVRREASA
jgi:flagellar biosynthesis/type III secretory pathway protein FliH